ncbi:AAA domain-containing protein [Phlebopus sp. FC_14]|nr:AAA domain-containing protein [Phlebopus sp. FC_14]
MLQRRHFANMAERQQSLGQLYVIGPSSTGKTTLCNAVMKSLNLPAWCYITEVARQVMRVQGYTRDDIGKIEMQRAIMLAQVAAEESACAQVSIRGGGLILSDRSGIDAIVYAILTANNEREAREKKALLLEDPMFRAALDRYRVARFLLLGPVPQWLVDDGVRSLEQHERCISVFREVLDELGIVYHDMGGEMMDLGERVKEVKRLLGVVDSDKL